MMLQIFFQQCPGFKEVWMIKAKQVIAFVEFEDDMQASIAMQALQGFKITKPHGFCLRKEVIYVSCRTELSVASEFVLRNAICNRTKHYKPFRKGEKMIILK